MHKIVDSIPHQFRIDQKLTQVLKAQNFTLSAEVIPPRNGTDQHKVLTQIHSLVQAGAQFLAVTKGAGGSLRGGSLPIAQLIKEQLRVPCIAHFTCRDLTPVEVENNLMDHHYFGIRNVLALRGDPPDGQTEWKSKEGNYSFAFQLIEQIRNLNSGIYLERMGGPKISEPCIKTDFCIGAAAYPDYKPEKESIRFFQIKVEAGADFGITDMLFDPESYARFRDDCAQLKINVPILPGTRLLKSQAQAIRLMSKFKINIPTNVLKQLPEVETADSTQIGLELFLQLSERLKSLGAPGIHLYVINDTSGSILALNQLRNKDVNSKLNL